MRTAAVEAGAETVPGPTSGEGDDVRLGEVALGAGHGGWIEARVRRWRDLLGRPQAAVGVGQLGIGEEPGLPLSHGQANLAIDPAVVVEEHQPDIALDGVPVHVNIVSERIANLGQPAVVGELTAQQAVDSVVAVADVDAKRRDQHQVGLAGLDHDPGGHVALVQVPGAGADIGLAPDGAQAHGADLGIESSDAIGQQQGRLGHAHLPVEAVLHGKPLAKNRADLSAGVDLQLATVEGRAGWRRRWCKRRR